VKAILVLEVLREQHVSQDGANAEP